MSLHKRVRIRSRQKPPSKLLKPRFPENLPKAGAEKGKIGVKAASRSKKKLLYASVAMNLLLLLALAYSSFEKPSSTTPNLVPSKPPSTKQDLSKAIDIQAGMAPADVLRVLGRPIKREFTVDQDEWHYCKTGERIDDFVYVRFKEHAVVELGTYTATTFHASGLSGDCTLFVRWGTFGQREPTLAHHQLIPPPSVNSPSQPVR